MPAHHGQAPVAVGVVVLAQVARGPVGGAPGVERPVLPAARMHAGIDLDAARHGVSTRGAQQAHRLGPALGVVGTAADAERMGMQAALVQCDADEQPLGQAVLALGIARRFQAGGARREVGAAQDGRRGQGRARQAFGLRTGAGGQREHAGHGRRPDGREQAPPAPTGTAPGATEPGEGGTGAPRRNARGRRKMSSAGGCRQSIRGRHGGQQSQETAKIKHKAPRQIRDRAE